MPQINLQKQVFDKNIYPKVIDTQFKQLLNVQPIEDEPVFTLDNFFELYEQLFYQIPREGEINSHRYILEKTADYLGVNISQDDVQALLDEITSLRQQILDSQSVVQEIEEINQTEITAARGTGRDGGRATALVNRSETIETTAARSTGRNGERATALVN